MKAHIIHREVLWHVNCCKCGKYWSMSDMKVTDVATLTCPHCGQQSTYVIKEDDENENCNTYLCIPVDRLL